MDTTAAIYVSTLPDIILQKRSDYLAFLKYTDGPFYYFDEKDIQSNLLQMNAFSSPLVNVDKVGELWKIAQASFFWKLLYCFSRVVSSFFGKAKYLTILFK